MATAEQIKALIKCYAEHDDTRFYRVALQLAAEQARKGHKNVARELRQLVDEAKAQNAVVQPTRGPVPITQPRGELEGVLTASFPKARFTDMVLTPEVERSLKRLLKEHSNGERLRHHGLSPRRKILLAGPPGTGKTMTARALAGELNLPLFTVRFDGLITRYMGETAAKLRLVFDAMQKQRGVYLFDEFDAIGAQRAAQNDVGEIRRVLNSFLQFLEDDASTSLIVAATNHVEMLDQALFRRFDDTICYENPDAQLAAEMMKNFLAPFDLDEIDWDELGNLAEGMNFAEIARACEDAAKDMVMDDRAQLSTSDIRMALQERQRKPTYSPRSNRT
ncbi:ATP-binding protein [Lujinxingia vulgaris]|uniref:ATP-binding protein n=1 Tax=Lujinxingia vulgaris TaxID=2600176 RepID=A0A5C6X9B5_9DELT|nr:ATP-binding protein [Lujinxingia vulgaris]TXD36976.1 ATP-binding protein [Lujinxingia vulgaris]